MFRKGQVLPDKNNDITPEVQVIRRSSATPELSAIRWHSRVSRDPKRRRRVEVGFLDTDKVCRMERDKMERFSPSGLKTLGILLKNLK